MIFQLSPVLWFTGLFLQPEDVRIFFLNLDIANTVQVMCEVIEYRSLILHGMTCECMGVGGGLVGGWRCGGGAVGVGGGGGGDRPGPKEKKTSPVYSIGNLCMLFLTFCHRSVNG